MPDAIPDAIYDEIRALILQKNYPCVAAIQSATRGEYRVGVYGQFGEASDHQRLRSDLLEFMRVQRETQSKFFSFWAVFSAPAETPVESPDAEAQFEAKLWRELSALTSETESATDWSPDASRDPADPSFCLSLAGEKLFVVGMHPLSSRLSRRFSRPALVFNTFSQFERLEREGTYEPMVKVNRNRDLRFQGSVNPMVLRHGDEWEAIQFSGRDNPDSWKCPFQFHPGKSDS